VSHRGANGAADADESGWADAVWGGIAECARKGRGIKLSGTAALRSAPQAF
jgi:hypothetical protein